MDSILSNLVEVLNDNVDETSIGDPHFAPEHYRVFPLSPDRFHSLGEAQSRRMAFIDGGNQEVIGAPNFSIQLNRIYFNIYSGTRRIIQDTIPHEIIFYSVTFSKLRRSAIHYDTQLFPLKEEWREFLPSESDLSFSSTDRTVMVGTMRADIQRVGSIARRFAEWSFSRYVSERVLSERDIIVGDGTLQTAFKNEGKYYGQALESAREKRVALTGLAKTSTLFTTTGLSLIGSVHKLAIDLNLDHSKWSYYPVAEGLTLQHGARIFVIKLHENSDHMFRFEMDLEQAESIGDSGVNDVIGNIASNSTDIGFPGYPYGLIEADLSARVTDDETQTQRVLILSELSKKGLLDKFARHMSAADAHNILDFLKSGGNVL